MLIWASDQQEVVLQVAGKKFTDPRNFFYSGGKIQLDHRIHTNKLKIFMWDAKL